MCACVCVGICMGMRVCMCVPTRIIALLKISDIGKEVIEAYTHECIITNKRCNNDVF